MCYRVSILPLKSTIGACADLRSNLHLEEFTPMRHCPGHWVLGYMALMAFTLSSNKPDAAFEHAEMALDWLDWVAPT
jgi:hypothetical protein